MTDSKLFDRLSLPRLRAGPSHSPRVSATVSVLLDLIVVPPSPREFVSLLGIHPHHLRDWILVLVLTPVLRQHREVETLVLGISRSALQHQTVDVRARSNRPSSTLSFSRSSTSTGVATFSRARAEKTFALQTLTPVFSRGISAVIRDLSSSCWRRDIDKKLLLEREEINGTDHGGHRGARQRSVWTSLVDSKARVKR